MTNPLTHIATHIRDWLTGADIARLHDEAVHRTVKRYTRGNVSVQMGRYLDENDLKALRKKSDSAYASLKD